MMAGSGRRVFTPGEVLTASNVMNYLQDQAVMNFAGTAARGSAIGTAVSEGMVSYLADSNDVQVYDGAAWNDLAYVSDVNARAGLVPIIAPTVSVSGGSAVANSDGSVSFTNATSILLNGVFTSSYRSYLVDINLTGVSTPTGVFSRFASSGTINTGNIYSFTIIYNQNGGGAIGFGSLNTNFIDTTVAYTGGSAPGVANAQVELRNPQLTGYTSGIVRGINNFTTGVEQRTGGFYTNVTTSFDGYALYPSSGNMTGRIAIYGYLN
jgi:hypothetical protein